MCTRSDQHLLNSLLHLPKKKKKKRKIPELRSNEEDEVADCEEEEELVKKVWIETRKLWCITGPAILSLVSACSTNVVVQALGGHLGDVQLAAISVANTAIFGFNFSLLLGMASALDTLCGQAASVWDGETARVGDLYAEVMDSALLVLFVVVTNLRFGHTNLKSLGRPHDVAELSGEVVQLMIPAHFSFAFLFTLQTFLQSQLKNRVIAGVFPVGLGFNVLTSWLFVYVLDYGIVGAAVAFDIYRWISVLCLFSYSTFGGCPSTWTGFSMRALSGRWDFVKLFAASGVVIWYCP